jgi:hypothetical protein
LYKTFQYFPSLQRKKKNTKKIYVLLMIGVAFDSSTNCVDHNSNNKWHDQNILLLTCDSWAHGVSMLSSHVILEHMEWACYVISTSWVTE